MSIRLHPKYGVNPTMGQCIVCGEDTGEIALLGAAFKGEAPRHMIVSSEPCKECREKYLSQGTLLFAITEETEFDRSIGIRKGTGKQLLYGLVIVKDEAFKGLFEQDPPLSKIVRVKPEIIDEILRMQDEAVKTGEGGEDESGSGEDV